MSSVEQMSPPNVVKCQSHDEWLAQRRKGIGSSDAPIIFGESPWSDPLTLWCQKLGLDGFTMDESEPMKWGHILEEPIAREFNERTGRDVASPGEFFIYQHPLFDWMQATPDRIQIDSERELPGLLEIKTANAFAASEWGESAPLHYQIQVQHQLAVTGFQWGTICVLIGGQQLKWFDIERNERFIQNLIRVESEFWTLVETEKPPVPQVHSESLVKALQKLHPDDNGESIELPADALGWDAELQAIKAQVKELEARKSDIENRIKVAIGAATFGKIHGLDYVYSWKTVERKGYEVKPSKTRQLTRSKVKQ